MIEKMIIKEHIFAKLANDIRDACQKREGAQCLREGITKVLREYFKWGGGKFGGGGMVPAPESQWYSSTIENVISHRFFVYGDGDNEKWLDREAQFLDTRQIPQLLAELLEKDKIRFLKWLKQDGINKP